MVDEVELNARYTTEVKETEPMVEREGGKLVALLF